MKTDHTVTARKVTGAVCRVQRSNHDYSIIRFGRNLQRDPAARWRMFQIDADNPKAKPGIMHDGPIPKSGRVKLRDLDPNMNYLVFAEGDKDAGVVTTVELNLKPPFFLTLDAPKIDRKAVEKARREAEAAQKAAENKPAQPMLSRLSASVRGALRPRRG